MSQNECEIKSFKSGGSMNKEVKTLGIDLAKNIFQLHGTNGAGKQVLSKRLGREQFIEFMSNFTPCLVGIEACSGSHYWARTLQSLGHKVKIIAPQFVKPYVMANKNDKNDARGIAEAVTRPEMKFVAVKTAAQQDVLMVHRIRELLVKQRTAQANQIRGLLNEYGIILPQGIRQVRQLMERLDEHRIHLSSTAYGLFVRLYEQFKAIDNEIGFYDQEIKAQAMNNPLCCEVMNIEGIGPMTASALVASIGDPNVFKNGREVSAWLGLTPKQNSSGHKIRLGGISKRGDRYLRTLLIHGARTVTRYCDNKTDTKSQWVARKKLQHGANKAAVALANKNARIIWAIMATGACYQPELACAA